MESGSTVSPPPESPGGEASIRWPPPGLERLQGDLARVTGRAALGGGIFVLPLLYVLSRSQGFASLGPFADAWWVPLVLATLGLAFSVDALVRTMTLMRRVSRALARGYDLTTIASVIADRQRDMGFLLTGSRHFSVMDAKERDAIAAIRVFTGSTLAVAGIWLPNGLAIGVLLAAHGLLSPVGLAVLTLLPSLVLYLFAAVALTIDDSRVRRARRAWHEKPWAEDLVSDEARQWRTSFADSSGGTGGPEGSGRRSRALARGSLVVGALAVLVSIPMLTLIPTSAIGPVLATLAVPGYDTIRGRAARAEALRSYVVPVDPGITPLDAGRLLQVLAHVGADRGLSPGERAPDEVVSEPWLPISGEPNPMGIDPFGWPDSLMAIVARGVTTTQQAYLADIAGHPARAEFARLARAGSVDVAAGRFEDPLPPDVTLSTMPVAWLAGLRAGGYAHIGAAAFELLEGRPASAEETVEEVVSLGLLIADGSASLIDDLVGYQLVDAGARALAGLYRATGQAQKAAELRRLRAVADRAVGRAHYQTPEGAEEWVRSLPALVTDTSVVRGLRWEYFIGVTTLTPCLNLQRMVFGPGDEYGAFLDAAHESLVAWPSEEGLFELAKKGWFASGARAPDSWVGRVLGIAMRRGEGSCGDAIRRFPPHEVLGPGS